MLYCVIIRWLRRNEGWVASGADGESALLCFCLPALSPLDIMPFPLKHVKLSNSQHSVSQSVLGRHTTNIKTEHKHKHWLSLAPWLLPPTVKLHYLWNFCEILWIKNQPKRDVRFRFGGAEHQFWWVLMFPLGGNIINKRLFFDDLSLLLPNIPWSCFIGLSKHFNQEREKHEGSYHINGKFHTKILHVLRSNHEISQNFNHNVRLILTRPVV